MKITLQESMRLKELAGILSEDSLSDLESKLKDHDWYYMMSDDSRAYDKGNSEEKAIKKMVKELGEEGLKLYTTYFLKYYPKADTSSLKSSMLSEVESDYEDSFDLDQSKGGVDNSLNKVHKQLLKVQQDMNTLFKDFKSGKITKDVYVAKRKPLQTLRAKLENDLL